MAELKEIDYHIAYQIIMNACWYSVDPCDCYDEFNFPLHSNIPSPEKLLIKKQTWENLSAEAREMAETILYATDELYDMLATRNKGILTKRSIRIYFNKIWQSKLITTHTINEITKWTNQL